MNIHTAIERITPAQAERYLERNDINRKFKLHHVTRLASDISEGRWNINGSSIVFNGDGTLLDGQHRLAAIVKAGVPVDMLVVRGVSKSAMATIDSGVSRSAGDVAYMQGYANATSLIGTIRLLVCAKHNNATTGQMMTTGSVMEFLRRHPHLEDSVAAARKFKRLMPTVPIAAWHYLAFYVGGQHQEVRQAYSVLETGIPFYVDDPIHVFREKAWKDVSSMQGSMTNRLCGLWTLSLAYNGFVVREPRLLLRLQQKEVRVDGVDYSKL
jgi:hypothetical protein